MAAGNRHLGYKEVLNAIEERSPGTKAAFVFGFLERAHDRFAGDAAEERDDLRPCRGVRRADARRRVRVLPAARAHARTGTPRPDAAGARARDAGMFAAGDRVLLVDNKKRRHLVTLEAGGQFHTHAGIVDHDDLDRPRRRHDRAHVARRAPRRGAADARPSTCSRCRAARR